MIEINSRLSLRDDEVELSAIRAQGPGGQNVNKVSSAIHLRFDIANSSLPEAAKEKLLSLSDHRVTSQGEVVIKAQQFRTQEKNREAAISRLVELIQSVLVVQKPRRPTKPSKNAKKKRMDSKTKRGHVKNLRGKVQDD